MWSSSEQQLNPYRTVVDVADTKLCPQTDTNLVTHSTNFGGKQTQIFTANKTFQTFFFLYLFFFVWFCGRLVERKWGRSFNVLLYFTTHILYHCKTTKSTYNCQWFKTHMETVHVIQVDNFKFDRACLKLLKRRSLYIYWAHIVTITEPILLSPYRYNYWAHITEPILVQLLSPYC